MGGRFPPHWAIADPRWKQNMVKGVENVGRMGIIYFCMGKYWMGVREKGGERWSILGLCIFLADLNFKINLP